MNNRILANLVPMCGFEPLTPYSIEQTHTILTNRVGNPFNKLYKTK